MTNQGTNNSPSAHSGPYETPASAAEASRAVYAAAGFKPGAMAEANHGVLLDACKAAEVYLGAYDHRILRWLAGFEPEACAVIAGLITRAHAGGEMTTKHIDLGGLAVRDLRERLGEHIKETRAWLTEAERLAAELERRES